MLFAAILITENALMNRLIVVDLLKISLLP